MQESRSFEVIARVHRVCSIQEKALPVYAAALWAIFDLAKFQKRGPGGGIPSWGRDGGLPPGVFGGERAVSSIGVEV